MATFRSEVDPELQLRVDGCGGTVQISGQEGSTIEINGAEALDAYLQHHGSTLQISGYPSDLQVTLPRRASVELHGIGNNVEVRAVAELGAQSLASLTARGVGGDVRAAQVKQITLDSVGGDARIEAGSQTVTIGRIGGNLHVAQAEQLSLHTVGGDTQVDEVGQLLKLGQTGGQLRLRWRSGGQLLGEGNVSGSVGGEVRLELPETAALTLSAIVGGGLEGSGSGWELRRGPGRHQLIFGEGGGQLRLVVGGELQVRGGTEPRQESFGGMPWGGEWDEWRGAMDGFGQEMRGIGRELEELGRNLARELSGLGRDIAREVRVAGRDARRSAQEDFGPGARRGPRMRVRFNDHEFNLDPEQIERIKREARSAAASGIARAQEAVEQALQQWQQSSRPLRPGPPPRPGTPPRGPVPPTPPFGGREGYTGQTVRIDREEGEAPAAGQSAAQASATPQDRDAERLAILRMVHEGRLAPDEAEVLLRGLDERG